MRFAASPLMVAVALGLLGPSVLEVEEDATEARAADNAAADDAAVTGDDESDAPTTLR